MRRLALMLGAVGVAAIGAAAWWRAHPRLGSSWVNRVVDPWLVGHGVVDRTAGEIGLVEHVGRKSGIVRVSPVHPVPTDGVFRIIVPLGLKSRWAQNVLAAGHCRLQVGAVVHELDEPMLVAPSMVVGLQPLASRVMGWLGFPHLLLHRLSEAPGILDAEPESGDVERHEELVPA